MEEINNNNIILSILILSLEERKNCFLKSLLLTLKPQLNNNVELVIVSDAGETSIGAKRNQAINLAKGKYFCFIDDDDRVSDNYIKSILNIINSDYPDCLVFDAWVTINGKLGKVCKYGIEFKHLDTPEAYYRLPNHIMVHKKENVWNIPFKEINFGEDDEWAKRILYTIHSQKRINSVLYYYDYSQNTSRSIK